MASYAVTGSATTTASAARSRPAILLPRRALAATPAAASARTRVIRAASGRATTASAATGTPSYQRGLSSLRRLGAPRHQGYSVAGLAATSGRGTGLSVRHFVRQATAATPNRATARTVARHLVGARATTPGAAAPSTKTVVAVRRDGLTAGPPDPSGPPYPNEPVPIGVGASVAEGARLAERAAAQYASPRLPPTAELAVGLTATVDVTLVFSV